MKTRHEIHPVTALFGMERYLFLLLIPIVRALLAARGLFDWFESVSLDIATVSAIAAFGGLRYKTARLYTENGGLCHTAGLFFRRETRIFPSDSLIAEITYPALYRPFRACKMTVCAPGKGACARFAVRKNTAENILKELRFSPNRAKTVLFRQNPKTRLYMALSSNILPGTIFLITLSAFFSRLLDGDLSGRALETAGRLSENLPALLPRIIRILLIVNGFGYLAAVLRSYFLRGKLTISSSGDMLFVSGGTFTKYCQIFPQKSVEKICSRRGFLGMRFYRFHFQSRRRIYLPINPVNIPPFFTKERTFLWLYWRYNTLKPRFIKHFGKN